MSDPRGLAGKVALIAGATGGIGEAIARALGAEGAIVVVAGRDAQKSAALAAGIPDATTVTMDAHDVTSLRTAVDAAATRHGGIDLFVNCAGIHREERVLDVTEEAFDDVHAVNLKAAMFLGQAVARVQVEGGRGGRHVHLLSVRAQLGMRDRGFSSYASSKGGLVMLVRQHALELAPHGITVNGVAPTVVRTRMAGRWLSDPEIHRQLIARIPLGRIAEPGDVTGPVLFFLSDAASYVTGQILYVDGGITSSQ